MDTRFSRTHLILILVAVVVAAGVAIPLVVRSGSHGTRGRYEPCAFESPDDLGQHVFDCLQDGDVEGFASACFSADEMLAVLDLMGLPKQALARAEEEFRTEGGQDRLLWKARAGFKSGVEQFDWNEADLERVEYETTTDDGVRGCRWLTFQVTHEGSKKAIHLASAIEGPEGWKIFFGDGFSIGDERAYSSRLNANEPAAIATLRNISSAQAQFQASAHADEDNDGTGEFGTFRELSGSGHVRGQKAIGRISPTVLSGAFRNPDGDGLIVRSGYYFAIYLPSAAGVGIRADAAGYDEVDADLSETTWCCYAWPVSYGKSGFRTFMVNQTGDVLSADSESYDGTSGPLPDAAFYPADPKDGDDMFSLKGSIVNNVAIGSEGRDGNVWKQCN